jgi:hypothetical protein
MVRRPQVSLFIDSYPEALYRFSAVAPNQWLRLAAIASSATQGLVLVTLGTVLLWQSSNIPDGLAAMAQEFVGVGIVLSAIGYFLTAFLAARRWLPWRIVGGLLGGSLTAIFAYIAIWFGVAEARYVEYAPAHDPSAWPPVLAFAIAALWVVAFVPVAAMVVTPSAGNSA